MPPRKCTSGASRPPANMIRDVQCKLVLLDPNAEGGSGSDRSESAYETCSGGSGSSSENANQNGNSTSPNQVVSDGAAAPVDDPVYNVQEILDTRIDDNGKKYYLIKWLDYDITFNSWEPEENIIGSCQDALDEYLAKGQPTLKKEPDQEQARTISPPPSQNPTAPDNENETAEVTVNFTAPVNSDGITSPSQNNVDSNPSGNDFDDGTEDCVLVMEIESGEVRQINVDDMINTNNGRGIYKLLITEDLTGKVPEFICGSVVIAESGIYYVLMKFENCDYLDVIPRQILE